MKKRVFSVLATVFVLLTGLFLTACGDKYKNFEYSIEYAFSADSLEWYDADDGVEIFHNKDDENLEYDQFGYINIYFRVDILNVDEKNIDLITVSADNLGMTTKTVRENEVFSISINPNLAYNSTLKFIENNTRRTKNIPFIASVALKSIEVDTTIKPAVSAGSNLDLAQLNNLEYTTDSEGLNTLQTGVKYEIASLGYYADGSYRSTITSGLSNYVTINGNVLTALSNPNATSYIARIKATSIYDPNIYAEFDVYIIDIALNADNTIFTPTTYDEDDNIISDITLYTTSVGVDNPYASKTIYVDVSNFSGIYKNGVSTIDGTVNYDLRVKVDGEIYDLNSLTQINGLQILREDLGLGRYKITIIASQDYTFDSEISFVYSIADKLTLTNSEPNYHTELTVQRRILPNAILINGESYLDGDTAYGTQYSTSSSTYKGIELTLEVSPADAYTDYKIDVVSNSNVEFSSNGKDFSTTYPSINNGDRIFVRLTSGTVNDQTITFRVLSTPKFAEAKYIEVDYTIHKVITADSIDVFSKYTEGEENTSINKGEMFIDANGNTELFLKVAFTGTDLDASTISLTLPESSPIKFGNGLSIINLADSNYVRQISETSPLYNVYAVKFASCNEIVDSTRVTISAGDNTLGVSTYVNVESVFLAEPSSIEINTNDENVSDFSTADKLMYAIVMGTNNSFYVTADVANNYVGTINPIQSISRVDQGATNAIEFKPLNNNEFIILGRANTTQAEIINLDVYYYTNENVEIKLTKRTISIEIAVYDTISNISLTKEDKDITYINSKYQEASEIDIAFSSNTAYSSIVASDVIFSDQTKSNANQLKVTLSDSALNDIVQIVYVTPDGEQILNSGDVISYDGANIYRGTIRVRLLNRIDYDSIRIIFSAMRFGVESGVTRSVSIDIADYILADGIVVSGSEIVEEGLDNYWIYMSFLSVVDGGRDIASFNASAEYVNQSSSGMRFDDLTYTLYKINEVDGKKSETLVTGGGVSVAIDGNLVTISAEKNYGGGMYRLELATLDSYYNLNGVEGYSNTFSLNLLISDGEQYAYTISNKEDFLNINNDLDANYVLTNSFTISDFTPIGGAKDSNVVSAFTGSLSGVNSAVSTAKNSITVEISTTVEDDRNTYAGLFARLGAGGTISNLDVYVKFSTAQMATKTPLYMGAVVGYNQGGTIENVGVSVINSTIDLGAISSEINFGLITGLNNGTISLSGSRAIIDAKITAISNKVNLGAITGVNTATILDSTTEPDWKAINYSVMMNLTYINKGQSANLNVGGVAGYAYGGSASSISGITLGGKIQINNEGINASCTANLGGIVGAIGNDANNGATITKSYTVGLDLINDVNGTVAGIVGTGDSADISFVRVISANVEFNPIVNTNGDSIFSKLETKGTIIGSNNVAGILGTSTNSTIRLSSVENFVTGHSTIESRATSANLGAITADGSATVEKTFVSANILNSGEVVLIPTNSTNSYFVGKISSISDLSSLNNIASASSGVCYAVVYTDSNIYYNNSGSWVEVDSNDWDSSILLGADYSSEDWRIDNQYNAITISILEGEISSPKTYYLPYLIKDGEPTMIIAPTDISADINSEYIIEIDSVYSEDYDYTFSEDEITSVAIINYHYDINNILDNDKYNTYDLDELINLTVVPDGASGGVRYSIVQGSSYAYINSDDQIVFTGVSGTNRIVVRCYSIFNSDIEEYVVFYTQIGLSGLIIDTDDVYLENENMYSITTYTGSTDTHIIVDAENIFGSALGLSDKLFQNIFDTNLTRYLSIQTVNQTEDSILTIEKTNNQINEFILKVSDLFTGNSTNETITFTLYFNATDYYGDSFVGALLTGEQIVDGETEDVLLSLGTINLKVYVKKSANYIVMNNGQQSVNSSSTANFSANLYTGYVSSDNTNSNYVAFNYNYNLNRIELNEEGTKDSINLQLAYNLEDSDKITTLLERTKKSSILDLFNYNFSYYAIDAQGNISTLIQDIAGYRYNISISLKDGFEYRYLTDSIEFIFAVSAQTNENVTGQANITFEPTEVSTIRLENYNASSVSSNGGFTSLVTSGTTSSYVISPGGYGGLMTIFLEPNYSNVLSATLSSSSLYVPSLGRSVTLHFEQLIYNESQNIFQSMYPANSSTNGIIDLRRESVYNGTTYEYTGIIYVRVFLERFSGTEGNINVTLDVKTSETSEKSISKAFLTQYLPGVSFNYDGIQADGGYLVQENTYNNIVELTVYGYEFNATPNIYSSWILPEGAEGYEINGNGELIYTDSENVKHNYNINDYINRSIGEIRANSDSSYTIQVIFSVRGGIPASFELSANMSLITDSGEIYSEEQTIVFHPTDYIVDNSATTLERINNGVMQLTINRTQVFEFVFDTNAVNYDYSEEIYDRLVENYGDIASLFSYQLNGKNYTLEDENSAYNISYVEVANSTSKRLAIFGLETLNVNVEFSVKYEFMPNKNNGKYSLNFTDGGAYEMSFAFRLQILPGTDAEHATAIYSADDIFDPDTNACLLNEGEDYILMNDITLENFTPIDVNVASFDGNNKIINITSFATPSESATAVEYGLFANIGTYTLANETYPTILKNIVVDYGSLTGAISFINSDATTISFGGLVGKNEGGLIYNCDVMNFSSSTKDITLTFKNSSSVKVYFGGLVGENAGTITNSRVGRSTFTRVNVSSTGNESINYNYGPVNPLAFYIGDASVSGQGFVAVAGGFVGSNSGKIASSYVANTSVISSSTAPNDSMTAGFVGQNNAGASIMYSYVKALESTVNPTNPYSRGARIQNLTNGTVAGFVNYNAGTITNSYANTELMSDSNVLSGFVYYNATSGVISESYSACIYNGKLIGENTTAEQPFVGRSNAELLSYGTIENCYYLISDGTVIDTSKIPNVEGQDQAVAVTQSNFKDPNFLNNFVFVLSNSLTSRNLGVWSYYTTDSSYRILPELMPANTIATSYRYLVGVGENGNNYDYAYSFNLGSANNSYIIQDVDDFNSIMTGNGTTSASGYFRLINDLAFDTTAVSTRLNFTLGDRDNLNVTSFEGNGMTISGIYLDAEENVGSSIGLFANIENAYVKNVNLEFESEFSSANITYAGGLAGKINNSVIVNINLSGSATTINGTSFAGGLAGTITGSSLIYGIKSNLNAIANNETGDFYTGTTYTNMSYAGGIAGLIDITPRENAEYNLSYIQIEGDEMNVGSNYNANIQAYYAGGVAGYAGSEVKAFRLKYNVGLSNRIRGQEAVGGLFGAFLGEITASQVTAVEDTQFTFDSAIGEYIISLENDEKPFDETTAGNLNLLEGYNYVGGIAGIALNTEIYSSYAKVGIYSGVSAGGLIGLAISPTINYSYAIPYINLDNISYFENVGGVIGETYEKSYYSDEISGYISAFNLIPNSREQSNLSFIFSTLIMDNEKLRNNIDTIINVTDSSYIKHFDYIAGYYGQDAGENYLHGNGGGNNLISVYGGKVNYANKSVNDTIQELVLHSTESRAYSTDLSTIFDTDNASTQAETFQRIFSSWPTEYWTLDSTRYFPLLLDRNVRDYIEIDMSNLEESITTIENNPSLSYKVVEDLDFTNITTNGNFIIEIGGDGFTGILLGEKPDGTTPTISGLNINARYSNEDSGFFNRTTGATISNLNFKWNTLNLNNKNIEYIGGVSCEDTGSRFTSINVSMNVANIDDDSVNNSGNIIHNNVTTQNATIAGFGGIVGEGTNSNIVGCTFTGNVSAKLSATENSKNTINVGGIIGRGAVSDNPESQIDTIGMIVTDSTVGMDNSKTTFNFELVSNEDIASTVNIGGAVGYASGAAISAVNVGNYTYETNNDVDISVRYSGTDNLYLGGLIGFSEESQIISTDSLTNINLTGGNIDGNASQVALGGLAGRLISNSSTAEFRDNATRANIIVGSPEISYIDNIYLSTGIAYISSSSTISTISQSLFTGEIVATNDEEISDKLASVKNIWAGGAVGYVDPSCKLVLEEIMSTADINVGSSDISNGTVQLFVGGLVGSGGTYNEELSAPEISIINCASAVKIVAISADIPNVDLEDIKVYIGGLVSLATKLTIENSYSATTILSDGLSGKYYNLSHIGAIVGEILNSATIDATETYYSSDIALSSEDLDSDSDGLYNLSAYRFVSTSQWHTNFMQGNSSVWTRSTTGVNYIPYITSLYDNLINYGIITNSPDTNVYASGSVLNPVQINNERISLQEDYTFYLLSSNVNNALTLVENSTGFISKLNGVLLAGETTYNVEFSTNQDTDLVDKYTAFIPLVAKHSAISNLHVVLKGGSEISYAISSESSITSIIAGKNEGVIFNSSVLGTDISLNGHIGTNNYFGVLVGENTGLISHSYSTVEILEINNAIGGAVSGIVVNNNGTINSTYFTGYINNPNITASGLIYSSVESENTIGYVHNSYMGGVITNVSNDGNSFIAVFDSMRDYGDNNFIDNLASFDTAYSDSTINSIIGVSTLSIMKADNLSGNWTTVISSSGDTKNPSYYIDMTSVSFGYNYGYPVYEFNKVDTTTTTYTKLSVNYQLYTGNGTLSNVVNSKDDNALTDDYIGKNLEDLKKSEVNNFYRIPHLGALHAIQGLANIVQNNQLTYTNLNYMLIYDIDATNYSLSNTAVGGGNNDSEFNLGENVQFNGRFISNKNYAIDTWPMSNNNTEEVCTISGLSKEGLFDNINYAKFEYLKFGQMKDLESSGALGVNVGQSKTNNGNVTVNNIWIGDDSATITYAGANVGGLFGTIQSGTVSISNFITSNHTTKTRFIKIQADGHNGLIASSMSGGVLNLNESNKLGIDFAGALGEEANSINGGIVGNLTGGTINGGNSEILVSNTQDSAPSEILGGIVGESSDASEATIDSVKVSFVSGGGIGIHTIKLGGFVGKIGGKLTISNSTIINDGQMEVWTSGYAEFGLISANVYGSGAITLNNITLNDNSDQNLEIIISSNIEKSSTSYGVLFGTVLGGTIDGSINNATNITLNTTNNTTDSDNVGTVAGTLSGGDIKLTFGQQGSEVSKFTIKGHENVGGVIGKYEGGALALTEISTTVYGDKNVGGFIGYAKVGENNLSSLINNNAGTGNVSNADIEYFNYLQSSDLFSTIYILGQQTEDSGNIGGIFGNLEGNLTLDSEEGNTQFITNHNQIYLGSKNTLAQHNIINVGGVAGQVSGNISNVNNYGSIKYAGGAIMESIAEGLQTDTFVITNVSLGGNPNRATYALNVGGIVGKVNSVDTQIEITNISNAGNIEGYQNVGGLIGYVAGANITNDIDTNTIDVIDVSTNDEQTTANTTSVSGVLNVGGAFGYVGNSSATTNISHIALQSVTVNGNSNVGGFIGTYTGGNIGYSTLSNTTVNGIYYCLVVDSLVNGNVENTGYTYIPTSVGGFIGSAYKSSDDIQGAIYKNTLTSVNVISAQEGSNGNTGWESTSRVISTIGNNMYSQNFATFDDKYSEVISLYNNNPNYVEFNDMTTGFGGFIGSVNTYATTGEEIDSNDGISTNEIDAVSISASLGINVGTFYGYYYDSEADQSNSVNVPKVGGDANVTGAYNIGGIVGCYHTSQNTPENLDSLSKAIENFAGNIYVQNDSKITGMYVGGVFGKFVGDATNLRLESKVTINTDSSYYIGGLIGRLEGNLTVSIKDDDSYNTGENKFSGAVDGDSVENFGGLVGMLKVEVQKGGVYATVIGQHNYAFTINTLENSNYVDVGTTYDAQESGTDLYLTAIAGYVNQDRFTISATSDSKWYAVSYLENGDMEIPNNPLNEYTFGWARDYTMFKTVQRNIPKSENNDASWDSISVVYDASYITYVGTMENLGLMEEGSEKDSQYYGQEDKNGNEYTPDYICYTIVEIAQGQAKLYSSIGIASVYYTEDGSYATIDDLQDTTGIEAETGWEGFGKFFQWIGAMIGTNNPPTDIFNIDISKTDPGLTKFTISEDTTYKTFEGTATSAISKLEQLKLYYFTVDDYYQMVEGSDGKIQYSNKNPTYFQFEVLYQDSSANKMNDAVQNKDGSVADCRAASGSLFEVNGIATTDMDDSLKTDESAYPWLKWVQMASQAALLLGGGTLSVFIGKAIGKVTTKTLLTKALKFLGRVAKIGFNIAKGIGFNKIIGLFSLIGVATSVANSTYIEIRTQTMGYMTPTYMREITYSSDGIVNYQTDNTYTADNGMMYIYYSANRPSDYYTSKYYVYYDGDLTSGFKKSDVFSTAEVNITGTSIISEGDYSGGIACTVNGINGVAYDYYIYANGQYYVIMNVVEVKNVLSQKFFNPNAWGENFSLPIYTYYNGYYYVAGAFNGSEYTIADRYNNNIVDINESGLANYDVRLATTANLNFIPVDIDYLKDDLFSVKNGELYSIDKNGNRLENGTTYYYGYGYLDKAYYTANGALRKTYNKTGEGSPIKPIVGQFECVGTSKPDGRDGIDYISATYTDNENISTTYYFTYIGTTSEEGKDYTDGFNITKTESTTGKILKINMYPYSYGNPYNSNTTIDKSKVFTTISVNNTKTTVYLIEEHILAASESSTPKLTQEATFYYFNGGWEYANDTGNIYYSITTGIKEPEPVTEQQEGQSDEEYQESIKNDIPKVALYSDNEDVEYFSYNQIAFALSKIEETTKDNIKYYKDYIEIDGTQYKYVKFYGTDTEESKYNTTLSEGFYYDGSGALYQLDDSTSLVVDDKSNDNGLMLGAMLSYGDKEELLLEEYNKNKYLINSQIQLYTRYKYSNTSGFNLNTPWGGNNYYLYRNGAITPNTGYTTYLVEGCRVILGGSGTYFSSIRGDDSNGAQIGSFTLI